MTKTDNCAQIRDQSILGCQMGQQIPAHLLLRYLQSFRYIQTSLCAKTATFQPLNRGSSNLTLKS